jgi:hypothetical protein
MVWMSLSLSPLALYHLCLCQSPQSTRRNCVPGGYSMRAHTSQLRKGSTERGTVNVRDPEGTYKLQVSNLPGHDSLSDQIVLRRASIPISHCLSQHSIWVPYYLPEISSRQARNLEGRSRGKNGTLVVGLVMVRQPLNFTRLCARGFFPNLS